MIKSELYIICRFFLIFFSSKCPNCVCIVLHVGWNSRLCDIFNVDHSSTERIWKENGAMVIQFRHFHFFPTICFYILQHCKRYDICLQYHDVSSMDSICLHFCIWLAYCIFSVSRTMRPDKIRRSGSSTGMI